MRRNVVALLGGLGNQLFQVSFGHWLEQTAGYETWYDVSFRRDLALDVLEIPTIGSLIRGRLLTTTRRIPTPDGRIARAGRLARLAMGPHRIVRDYSGPGPDALEYSTAAWWFGYWQRRIYAETLNTELGSALAVSDTGTLLPIIGVHVRRGDMLDTPAALPASWFASALQRLRAEFRNAQAVMPVRVWTDDPKWCREKLDLGEPFDVVRPSSAVDHLAGLSGCRALVLSRSTFSWWAGSVATGKGATVVYPTPWWAGAPDLDGTIVYESWLPVGVDARDQLRESTG